MEETKVFQGDDKGQNGGDCRLSIVMCITRCLQRRCCIRTSPSVGVGIIRCWAHLTASGGMSRAVCPTVRVTTLGPHPVIVRARI